MTSLSRYALPGIIVLSGLGALFMALLVVRYGFPSSDEDAEDTNTRLVVTRIGHAVAAVCFAASAILAVVALSARTTAPPAFVATPTNTEQVSRLGADVQLIEERLNRELNSLEDRLGAIESARSQRARAPSERAAADLPQTPAPSSAAASSAPPPSSGSRSPRRPAPTDEAASALPGEPLQQV